MVDKPRPNQTAVIASLAILKVNADRGIDYIENFVPFVAECLRKSADDVVSISQLQEDLRSEFGLDIDQAPLRTILDRVVKSGLARRESHAYVRDKSELDRKVSLSDTREKTLREVNALVARLVGHSESLLSVAWTVDEAESALLHYLASRGTSLLATSSAKIPIALPDGSAPNAEYVLASFISSIHRTDPEGFEFLTSAVKGSVLVSVLYFDDFGSIGRHFDKLDVYLDTVVLMQALGLLGPSQQAATLETMTLARELGARMWCFKDTLKEIDGVLSFAANYVRRGQRRDIPIWGATEFLVQAGKTSSDIDLLAAHLEADLRGIGVRVRDRPPHVELQTIDEEAYAARLRKSVRYRSDAPLQHDLDAVTAIHRLRGGSPAPRIETSGAIFVTTNTPLARATTAYFREEYKATSFAPLCMPVHQFGTLAWLKKPLRSPELPTKLLLADAVAALNPPESIWKEYVREIAKLEAAGSISVDDCYLLRYSPAAKEALMGVTIGGSSAFLQGSVPEIMERVRAAERREAESVAVRERGLREQAEADAARALAEAREASEREVADAELRTATLAASQRASAERQAARYRRFGLTVSRVVTRTLLTLFLLASAVQVYGLSPWQPLGPMPDGWTNPLVGLSLVGLFIIGLVLSWRGEGLRDELAKVEQRVGSRVAVAAQGMVEGERGVQAAETNRDNPAG